MEVACQEAQNRLLLRCSLAEFCRVFPICRAASLQLHYSGLPILTVTDATHGCGICYSLQKVFVKYRILHKAKKSHRKFKTKFSKLSPQHMFSRKFLCAFYKFNRTFLLLHVWTERVLVHNSVTYDEET